MNFWRYCREFYLACENIAYGSFTGIEVVINLIIDDGVKSRGHRTNLFHDKLGEVGIAASYHSK